MTGTRQPLQQQVARCVTTKGFPLSQSQIFKIRCPRLRFATVRISDESHDSHSHLLDIRVCVCVHVCALAVCDRLQLSSPSPIHILGWGEGGIPSGPWSVCEKFLNWKGSFFGTLASFLFRHLKHLGEPYKDQERGWPKRLSDTAIAVG